MWSSRRSSERGSSGSISARFPKRTALTIGAARKDSVPIAHVGKRSTMQPHASSVVMLNQGALSWLSQAVPRLLQAPLWVSCTLGAALYVAMVTIFAALYFGLGEACFDGFYSPGAAGGAAAASVPLGEAFNFVRAFWLSVHTFSTVGFGNVYPVCASAEFFVLLESYSSLLVTVFFSGFMLFAFLRPRSRVRFSKNYLLSTQDGELHLTLRMVRESPHALRDARAVVQAHILAHDTYGAAFDRVVELKLEGEAVPTLDCWLVSHSVDHSSPLWEIRDELEMRLTSLEVSLCVYDTAYMQEVRLYATYAANEFVRNAHFVPMTKVVTSTGKSLVDLSRARRRRSREIHEAAVAAAANHAEGASLGEPSPLQLGGTPVLHVDHEKLDEFVREGERKLKRRQTFGRSVQRSFKNLFGGHAASGATGFKSSSEARRASAGARFSAANAHVMPAMPRGSEDE